MLYKPVYLKPKKMKEPLVKMGKPRKQPPNPPSPSPQPPPAATAAPAAPEVLPQEEPRLPLLVSGPGVQVVIPADATRDVLAGKVDYYLVDDSGVTLFKAKHLFCALKLDKEARQKYDYPCVGAHQRVLQNSGKPKSGLRYRRRYISPELLKKGIY